MALDLIKESPQFFLAVIISKISSKYILVKDTRCISETPDHHKPPIIVTMIALAARRTIPTRYY